MGVSVVLAKVGDGLEVRRQPAGQPHQFHVALRFTFQPAAGMHPVEITVNEQLQHRYWVVCRTPRIVRLRLESQAGKVQLVNENNRLPGPRYLQQRSRRVVQEKVWLGSDPRPG